MRNRLPKIIIDVIPHKEQRYDTCGDYFMDKDVLHFKISKCNPDSEFIVLIHEMVEWYLGYKKGLKIEDVDKFDIRFEQMRKEYPEIVKNEEPGFFPTNPYYEEHKFADKVERILADRLGLDWGKHSKSIESLDF